MTSLLVRLFADLLAAAQEIQRKLRRDASCVLTAPCGDPANQIIIAVGLGCRGTPSIIHPAHQRRSRW
jgi:hypothetical protein